jgi:hypothetical protein
MSRVCAIIAAGVRADIPIAPLASQDLGWAVELRRRGQRGALKLAKSAVHDARIIERGLELAREKFCPGPYYRPWRNAI